VTGVQTCALPISSGPSPQTISFDALPDRTYGDPDFTVHATASSGLAVSFAAAGNCTVNGATVHIAAAGSCTITASQAGDSNWAPAPSVPRTFAIVKASQTITITTHAPLAVATGAGFAVAATAPGGLVSYSSAGACTNSGAAFTASSSAGTCSVRYDQAGNANYKPAPQVTETVAVSTANQTIAFAPLAGKTFGDPDFTVSATASSGLPVGFTATGNCTLSGTTVHITGAGSCTVTASQAGNSAYSAAPSVSQTFAIAKASQTIAFGPLPNRTIGAADFTVSAAASSGLAVSFAASGTCTVAGSTVHLTGVGSCTITAAQAGNANFNAATPVAQTFSIVALTPAPTCKVPKVVGKTLAAARAAITRSKCRVGRIGHAHSHKVKKGIVISQSRRPGSVVAANTKINLVISLGRKRK